MKRAGEVSNIGSCRIWCVFDGFSASLRFVAPEPGHNLPEVPTVTGGHRAGAALLWYQSAVP
jgi:hypothetical protein